MHTKQTTEQSVTVYDPSKAYGGYTLFAPHFTPYIWLIDMKGRVVKHWKMPYTPGGDVRLLPNGNQIHLRRMFESPSAYLGSGGNELIEIDWDGNIVWKYEGSDIHHDFRRLKNGNTMLNRYVKIPPKIAAKVKGGIPGTEPKDGMWGAAFTEITPDGKVVWEWLGYEHMDFEKDVHCPLERRSVWGYVNGIDVFPNGDVVGSFRYINNLLIIDRQTSDIKWRWGTWELGHQHNPTVLPNGNVLCLDNGYHRRASDETAPDHRASVYSRAVEVNPKTNKLVWEYKDEDLHKFHSSICSSADRLPNGNTLICESTQGRIFEVTPDSEVVWEFFSPFYEYSQSFGWTNLMFRAHRFGYDYPGLKGKDLDPDRFEWMPKEKAKLSEEALRKRLGHLGY